MQFFEKLSPLQAQQVNSLVLAHVGDAVQSLYVREKLATQHSGKAAQMHQLSSQTVNAGNQAAQAEKLLPLFSEEEKQVYLRGRNSKTHHKAKNQSGADYRKATGLEAVFGYLYLTGQLQRLQHLLDLAHQQQNDTTN